MTREEKLEMIQRCRALLGDKHYAMSSYLDVGNLRISKSPHTSMDAGSSGRYQVLKIYFQGAETCISTWEPGFDDHNADRTWNNEDKVAQALAALRREAVLDDLAAI